MSFERYLRTACLPRLPAVTSVTTLSMNPDPVDKAGPGLCVLCVLCGGDLSFPVFLRASLLSQRRCLPAVAGVISFLAVPPASRHRLPVGASDAESSTASCNTQLQLAAFPRSVDYAGLKSDLSPFRINTSKNSCTFRISLISGQLKSPIINTSANSGFKLFIINTSKKHGGWGVQLQLQLQLETGAFLPTGRQKLAV